MCTIDHHNHIPDNQICDEGGDGKGMNLVQRLMANGDINYWDSEIEKAANVDEKCVRVNILLQRGESLPRILKFNLPSLFFENQNLGLCVRYLTASIYNEVVCNGAAIIAVFMNDKNEERRLSILIDVELKTKYENMNIYGNFGDDIRIIDSSTINYHFTKELQKNLVLSPDYKNQNCCIGVDVGGTNIKTVVMNNGEVVYRSTEPVEREKGGKLLKSQIMLEIMKARLSAEKTECTVECLGLNFPSPVKRTGDGSFKIVRLTNFERYWKEARKGSADFREDYDALNGMVDEIRNYDIQHIEVRNDADAFGFGEVFHRLSKGESERTEFNMKGIKVVLPIGTGPGYVKIKNGMIENTPNQGGHIVIDLAEDADVDPGCGVKGCYGGYVPASAMALRARKFNIGVTGNDDFIPADLNGTLRLMGDIGRRIAQEAMKLHKITGANEVILAGGISGGETGVELARSSNEVIRKLYPEYSDRVRITLSQADINFGGAIGAAQYALASKNTANEINRPKWDFKYNIPDTTVGKNIIQPFFDKLNEQHKKICIITLKEVEDFFKKNPEHYPWFITLQNGNHVFHIGKDTNIDDMMSVIKKGSYDIIIPIGAGTVTDWAKYVGSIEGKEVICIPSTVSGNAMFTEKAIFYKHEGKDRKRESVVSGPPAKVIFDLKFLRGMLDYRPTKGISAERANRAGAGDIVSIHPALFDWDLAVKEGKEHEDKVIYNAAHEILDMTQQNAEFIRDNTELGMVLLIEMLAESSLLNMRFGTSRPKDGSEHLLADQIDESLPMDMPKLHGEQVTIASLIMGYLYGTKFDERPYTKIRDLATALGLPTDPTDVGMQREKIIEALQNVRVRPDKYTYFDNYFGKNRDRIGKEKAELIYERVFGARRKEIEEFRLGVCRDVNNSVKAMFYHINDKVLPSLDSNSEKIEKMIDLLTETKQRNGRVIINAAGRVGEIAVFFQQKLRALGFNVDDFKEITPEFLVNINDLVLTFSGSGKTCSVVDNLNNVHMLHKKKRLHRQIFSVTAKPRIKTWHEGDQYHVVMEIPGRSKDDTNAEVQSEGDAYLPLSSTFEYSTMLFLEGIIEVLVKIEIKENNPSKNTGIVRRVIRSTLEGIKAELTQKLLEHEAHTAKFVNLLKESVKKGSNGELLNIRRVYIFGLGQNNYVARLFARRIQNIGFEVYVPGPRDIISSSRKGDIAILISNSGRRGVMLRKIDTAQKEGCYCVAITAAPNSALSKKCSKENGIVIPISSRFTKAHTVDIMNDNRASKQKREKKRAFELAAMFYLEGISVAIMNKLKITEKDLKHVACEWE